MLKILVISTASLKTIRLGTKNNSAAPTSKIDLINGKILSQFQLDFNCKLITFLKKL
ncbi:hypothetical protein V2P72_00830 [Mesomycoplasma hyopneumoniae]|uniref:hypothetical protein n=1 Tax=Mesomycoplasma hyopneumoniae TaxID=2099 RepID=UPI001F31C446|nr:hypothetical protein [Mesomycoplasma hyopneumoniae]